MRRFLVIGVLFWSVCGHTLAVHNLQVTIGAGTTQVTATSKTAYQVFFQNNQTHSMRMGDSTATSSVGVLLASGSPGGSWTVGPIGGATQVELSSFWVAGTQSDVLDVAYVN